MRKIAGNIKDKLNKIIIRMSQTPKQFVKNPKSDFTRKRKLPFCTTLKILLSMGGKSISSELLEYFDYSVTTASASAFISSEIKSHQQHCLFCFASSLIQPVS